jgi:hypothetical protein
MTLAIGVMAMLAFAGPAEAATVCNGSFSGASFPTGITVPTGGRCTITGSTVTGDVVVQPNAAFQATDSTINGDIGAQNATIQLVRSHVTGQVNSQSPVNYPVGPENSLKKVYFCGSTINGSVQVTGAASFGSIEFGGPNCPNGGNTIGGNLVDTNNAASPNHIISGNRIGYTLYCVGNSPPPTGGGNTAPNKVGQCASL